MGRQFESNKDIQKYCIHKRRLVGLVDRRDVDSVTDKVYLYEPSVCGEMPDGVCSAWYLNASKSCLVPRATVGVEKKSNANDEDEEKCEQDKLKYSNIGSGDGCKGALMTIGFHVKSEEEIKCYLYFNGQMTRFLPKDMRRVLPQIINMDSDQNQSVLKIKSELKMVAERQKYMEKNIIDVDFDLFQEASIKFSNPKSNLQTV